MFDLPIPQPVEEPAKPQQSPEGRFPVFEYESGNNNNSASKSFYKKFDWVLVPVAVAGTVFGYFANSTDFGNLLFTASLLASAVFLYVFRR